MSFCQCGRVLPWKVHGRTCSCVCAMRYISARARACSHSLFVFGWPFCFPHLSLFSCTVRNICPKLVQSRSQFTEQITHLININCATVSSWKPVLSFHVFAPKYYYLPWKFISYIYASWTTVSPKLLVFLQKYFFLGCCFGPPPPLKR